MRRTVKIKIHGLGARNFVPTESRDTNCFTVLNQLFNLSPSLCKNNLIRTDDYGDTFGSCVRVCVMQSKLIDSRQQTSDGRTDALTQTWRRKQNIIKIIRPNKNEIKKENKGEKKNKRKTKQQQKQNKTRRSCKPNLSFKSQTLFIMVAEHQQFAD